MPKLIHVAAAVILNAQGQILLARRPEDKHQGGLWEFPGGKVEPAEPVVEALARELDEELGIQITTARPLIQIPHHYPDKSVLLDVYEVSAFEGEAYGREGQPIAWVDRSGLASYEFPAANKPIVAAALLPSRLLITGGCDNANQYLEAVEGGLNRGAEGVMLRAKHLADDSFVDVARSMLEYCRTHNVFLTLNTGVELANDLGADGLHLSSARLMAMESRDQFVGRWLSASCHNVEELAKAQALGVDFVTLSPVAATASHPETPPMGWERFTELVAETTIPVYALGGMGENTLRQAWDAGAQGVAAISAWWE
ncbi:Nudix family hydrolase [Pontibacterium granulatum]|uniref:Nudix family hydrolase n=1 Tax=Pontibacterium granulatum TaxID=2036029 RepID=UPI00249B760E|nr:Nudix family hydrolase [Pontibacterium granulatum]MDI3323626.1 Nudix family hydrolase [Pontibacterium granulatum]